MEEIKSILTGDTEDRMYLLYGDPASGKTVMGLSLARELEREGYTSLYCKLTEKSKFDTLWQEIEQFGNQHVLFILDDVFEHAGRQVFMKI
ncbi:hypothetical protein GMJAKD_07015 [Candidatus Electrothrix aarhusensis]